MSSQSGFESYLAQVRADTLRKIAVSWGHQSVTRKEQMIAAISDSLRDPAQVKRFVAGLEPLEQAALSVLRSFSGLLLSPALLACLRAAGHALPSNQTRAGITDEQIMTRLIERGVMLTSYQGDPGSYYGSSFYGGAVYLFSDPRVLQHAAPLQLHPIVLPPAESPPEWRHRRPQAVLLDLMSLTRTISESGGLVVNRNGTVRANDIKRLAKSRGWEAGSVRFDGMLFRDPTGALLEALIGCRLLAYTGSALDVVEPDFLTQRSIEEVVSRVLGGFCRAQAWSESDDHYFHESFSPRYNTMRAALLTALTCLPTDSDAAISVADLSNALFERLGEHHSLGGNVMPFYVYGRPNEQEIARQRAQRAQQLRTSWEKNEQEWIVYAIASWLYFLGMVEVGVDESGLRCFRLSEFGRRVLHPQLRDEAQPAAGPAWTVQPDFEVLVYLEHATPTQISLIERIAERAQAASHMARYRISRDSIYQALERGAELSDLLERLAAGASGPLPQNVLTSIREWASQRDRLTLRRRASLLEFPSEAARDAALSDGIGGQPLGERFVLLDANPGRLPTHTVQSYIQAPPASLRVSEGGAITIAYPARDLFTRALIERWAEPAGDGAWQLTAASVAAACKRGWTGAALLSALNERSTNDIPALLQVAIRAWAGARTPARIGEATLLRFDDPAVVEAIVASERFAPLIEARLGPTALLVRPSAAEAIRAELRWAGITPAEI